MAAHTQDITLAEAEKIIQTNSVWKVVMSLLQKGLIYVYENMDDAYTPKWENYVFLQYEYQQPELQKELIKQLEKAPKQLNILLAYLHLQQTEEAVMQKELLKRADATGAQLKALVDKAIFRVERWAVDRMQYRYDGEPLTYTLSDLQLKAYRQIQESFALQKPVLLKGITGSGKTLLYFNAIQECIDKGQQALYLLPEIALTAQMIRKLRSVFGDKVGIYHSRFSNNERVEVWHKIRTGQLQVVLGARSALFLPFRQLGLIIVDEEHDSSYKQHEPAPRYHARDAALVLAQIHKAQCILGSATPSMESYQNAKQKKYTLVTLNERYGTSILPQVECIDIKKAIAEKKVKGIFTTQLLDAIVETLQQKKQVILFQNRRGYSPFCICTMCGWVPQCKNCDVALTYHKYGDKMHCHYCGHKQNYIRICAACGSNKLTTKSFGTEKVEDDIKQLIPHARVQRFDWDALRIKNKYQEIVRQFEKGQIDILVGTQMIVKGLDFEHVHLVGVLNADNLLSAPDFRVNERVFQLLEQVAGRAGRRNIPGKVLIQTYKPEHPILQKVIKHDYESFFENEMLHRLEFLYPPHTRLIRITFRHKVQTTCQEGAIELCKLFQQYPQIVLFGPAEPPIARLRNMYLQEVLLKLHRDTQHIQQFKAELQRQIAILCSGKKFSSLRITIDIDP